MCRNNEQRELILLARRLTFNKGHNNRPESPVTSVTWHASKYKVSRLHQKYILKLHRKYTFGGVGTFGAPLVYVAFTGMPNDKLL